MKSCEFIAREAHERWKEDHRDSPRVSTETMARINEVAVRAARMAYQEAEAQERTDSDPTDLRVTGVLPGYESLMRELMGALDQAQKGKGAERHNLGGGIPFERQRMQQISELVGSPDGMVYQACKKITEGVALPTLDRKVAELYGAINYIAGIIVFLKARETPSKVAAVPTDDNAPTQVYPTPEKPKINPIPKPADDPVDDFDEPTVEPGQTAGDSTLAEMRTALLKLKDKHGNGMTKKWLAQVAHQLGHSQPFNLDTLPSETMRDIARRANACLRNGVLMN